MNNLLGELNQRRGMSEVQLIQQVVKGYNFIDYALVQEYNAGKIKATLCHKLMGKDITVTGVEVLSPGSKAFSTKYKLVKGDIVMLYSSKGFVATMSAFTEAVDNTVDSYDVITMKALPLSVFSSSKTQLDIGDDGGFDLKGEKFDIKVTAAGDIKIKNDSGSIELGTDGKFAINGNTNSVAMQEPLATALSTFLGAVNGQFTAVAACTSAAVAAAGLTLAPYVAVPLTLDISAAKSTTGKIGS